MPDTVRCCNDDCDAEIEIHCEGFPLGFVLTCTQCGQRQVIDGDYIGEDSWGFWTIEAEDDQ